jgi:hypothetical protein
MSEITIVDRIVVKEVGDRMEVEWGLSAEPEPEWAEIFQMAATSDREGPVDWVMGGGPDVMDSVIRWFVPVEVIDNADAEVRHRLSVANGRFGGAKAGDRW